MCYSLNLAASNVASEFPSTLDDLLKQVHNYFLCSPFRSALHQHFWDLLNVIDKAVEEIEKDFHRFVKLPQKKWLAIYSAEKVLRQQYFELTKYFEEVVKLTQKTVQLD